MKSSTEERYISVEQTNIENDASQKLKIRITDLSQIIDTLLMYQKEMSDSNSEICKNYLLSEQQNAVVERYLKGISIKNLELQFDCTKEIIVQVLSEKNIEIVEDNEFEKRERIRRSKLKY